MRSNQIVASVAFLGMLAASHVWAQEPAATGEGAEAPLQEVTVTATRHEEAISKVPISITAMTQQSLDERGIKDILDVSRFTPGVNIDTSGTNNIAIRGIASSGGAGTTGIYLDDTPIQMRALAFNPDEALPKTFDIERVEILRGPQGTLFGAGSEGGTVRYITAQPDLARNSIYGRTEVSYTEGGEPSYEAGVAAGGPVVQGKFAVRASVWYRYDGGYIDRVDPVTGALVDPNANRDETFLARLAALWAITDNWTVTPSIYYQNRERHQTEEYWPIYSDPGNDHFVTGSPTPRITPDKFYLPALKIQGDFAGMSFISNTSYYHREEQTGYDGTLYNLGFFQTFLGPDFGLYLPLMLDGTGLHLPPGATDYRAPATVDNGQENITQELRLQSADRNARLVWTVGAFFAENRQTYLEQIHDPMLNTLTLATTGLPYDQVFTDADGNPVPYVAGFDQDSYFLQTHATDKQYALYGEATYALLESLKLTAGVRYSWTKYDFFTYTGGPQLFAAPATGEGAHRENAFTPRVSISWQIDPNNLLYASYAKGFRPGGANNPVPYAACATDFQNFGVSGAPETFNSDTVNSYEIGAKNNLSNSIRIASSIYYIRWNNIQQTVVPPICQISFIDNLGQALAWGGDIQADIAITRAFTAELALGYTDARYTQDAVFGSGLIAAKGNAIAGVSGQPGSPFTATLGLEYRFSVHEHEAYVRADDEYEAHAKWFSPSQDPNTLQYDGANFTLPATNFLSLRTGLQFGSWDVSAFVDNLLDTHVQTNYAWSINPGYPDPNGANTQSRLFTAFTFRPRTMGVTAIFHY
ncbi:MAG TPA: TonB-dependent receptor [Steroidobacteraceae bacterium]|nr:TonB-dependent receptor [Steroidobacteraceae bacterium]